MDHSNDRKDNNDSKLEWETPQLIVENVADVTQSGSGGINPDGPSGS